MYVHNYNLLLRIIILSHFCHNSHEIVLSAASFRILIVTMHSLLIFRVIIELSFPSVTVHFSFSQSPFTCHSHSHCSHLILIVTVHLSFSQSPFTSHSHSHHSLFIVTVHFSQSPFTSHSHCTLLIVTIHFSFSQSPFTSHSHSHHSLLIVSLLIFIVTCIHISPSESLLTLSI